MNIAIIDDEEIIHDILRSRILEVCNDCRVECFNDSTDFGRSNLRQFDLIIADNRLPNISGRELLKSISLKTKAHLLLMSAYDADFLIHDVKENYIDAFISKDDISSLLDHIKYINAKLRITRMLDLEEGRIADRIKENGYTMEINGLIMVIGLSNILSEKSKNEITEKIKTFNYSGIVFFSEKSIIGSIMMKELIYFYKLFKDEKKKFCFWNAYKQEEIKLLLHNCNLDRLIKIFDNMDEAISYLTPKEIINVSNPY